MSNPGGRANPTVTVYKPSNPAAGADLSYALTAAGLFVSLYGLLTTSITVANRFPALEITDSGGAILWAGGTNNAQAASLAQGFTFGSGLADSSSVPRTGPGPTGLVLPAGALIKTNTASLQTTDQWSAFAVCVQVAE